MEESKDSLYYKGYIEGYRDGMKDAESGKTLKETENDILEHPIKAMAISSRACNCLSRAGCTYIADVVSLNERTIATMRNLGSKSASEIARWLDENGVCYSAWSKYL